ncbi:MAG: heavy metal-responsive transcriptional regulator [Deltaproteobacteria bacterium]|nr:heavy metal-responsive transcriptional regulator [Deltaproteobacteria bacterium]
MKELEGFEMQIGEIAKLANVNIQTIRFYERQNLLRPTARKRSGYRLYDEGSLKQIRFIREAQALGFTLAEIRALMSLRYRSASGCESVRKKAEEKLKSIRDKISVLRKMETALEKLVADCKDRDASECCPFLDRLKE